MNMKFFRFLILLSLILTACTDEVSENIIGRWEVSDIEVKVPDVPPQLVRDARSISLATRYEFRSDGRFRMTVTQNKLEEGRKHKGQYLIHPSGKQLIMKTDSLRIKRNGKWENSKRNDYNRPMFRKVKMQIEENRKNRIILSEKEGKGKIYFILERMK